MTWSHLVGMFYWHNKYNAKSIFCHARVLNIPMLRSVVWRVVMRRNVGGVCWNVISLSHIKLVTNTLSGMWKE